MKCYVGCGTLRNIISANNEMEACVKTVQMVADAMTKDFNIDYKIGPDFLVNETGWSSEPTTIIDTAKVFKEAGWDMEEGEF